MFIIFWRFSPTRLTLSIKSAWWFIHQSFQRVSTELHGVSFFANFSLISAYNLYQYLKDYISRLKVTQFWGLFSMVKLHCIRSVKSVQNPCKISMISVTNSWAVLCFLSNTMWLTLHGQFCYRLKPSTVQFQTVRISQNYDLYFRLF